MTTEAEKAERIAALRERLSDIRWMIEILEKRERMVRLSIEEAEGRGEGKEAVWLRALLAGDHATAARCYAEWVLGEGTGLHEDSVRRAKERLGFDAGAAAGT